jgi:hypothetical protein
MPGLYIYAITETRRRPPLTGLFGRPLRTIGAGGVHAIVEEATRAPKPTLSRLRAQDRILRAVSRHADPMLPARFGSFARDARELRGTLEGRARELARALKQARGCAQMTVRLFLDDVPGTSMTPPRRGASRDAERRRADASSSTSAPGGAAYLRQLLAEDRARRSHPAVRALQRAARGVARAERIEWHDGAVAAASVYHLVPRARLQAYLEKVAAAAAHEEARIVVSGPFLPFAFGEGLR